MNVIKNKCAFVFSILLCLGSITGCTNDETSVNETTVTVTDMVDDSITIKKNPEKVACISRTTYDFLVAFGLGDKIDGAYSGTLNNDWVSLIYPKSADHYVYKYENSYELFLSRGIDLVLAPEKYIADDLNSHGIPALCVSLYGNPTFDNYVTFFSQLVTQIWDDPAVKVKADAWENKVNNAITDIQSELSEHEIQERTLYYIRGDKDKGIGYTDTKGSFTEYAYRILGFDFIGADLTTNKPSIEEIIASNPDTFVAGGIYQNRNINLLKTTEPYSSLDAVINDSIYSIPVGFTAFEQISAMTPIFLYDQANKIYPDYFSYDINKMIKESVLDYFGMELTDEQISYMKQGLSPKGESQI